MKLVALICTRNSDWVIGLSLRAALMVADEAVVLLHNCTDRTAEIVEDVSRETQRVSTIVKDGSLWPEMAHRQLMLEVAREQGATHILLIDDDEVISGNLLPSIRGHIKVNTSGFIFQLPWLQLRDGIGHVMKSGMWGEQNVSTAFRDRPDFHWATTGLDGYDHHHRHPLGASSFLMCFPPQPGRNGGLMHLQFASRRRLLAKQAWYQAVETIRWPNRKMADYVRTVRESEAASVAPVPESWWRPYGHLMQYLDVYAEPWQERELHRMIAEHGRERFKGCDFFGVA